VGSSHASSAAGSSAASSSAGSGAATSAPPVAAVPAPAPVPNGRKIVQSSILELGTPAKRIDAVAQEVFDEVRAVNGIVESSNVSSTGGPGASAQFQLRVPSQYLADALTALSKLRYANVISRTDNTQDVNSPYLSLQREIAAAKAALIRLRAKLAAATSATEIATLKQQIATENATLAHDQGSFQGLNRQVDFSNLYVTLQATTGGGVTPAGGGKGGFGLHQAGHDALRVLEVTAGVALIVLAALIPVGLLVALAWWVAGTVQRRRRERALDLA
jgi:ribosomal protein L29